MRVAVTLIPTGPERTYDMAYLPRVGDVLNLEDASDPGGDRSLLLETRALYVAQVIHDVGINAGDHAVTLRVMPIADVPDYPGRNCSACRRGIV